MNFSVKQFFVRVLLSLLRGLILVKRHGGAFFSHLAAPVKGFGLFFVRVIGVPMVRVSLVLRRSFQRLLFPAKHQFVYLVSNRFTIHVMMVLIVATVAFVNVSARDVRAEDFGQQSLLYRLVSTDVFSQLEVVEAGSAVLTLGGNASYLADAVVDAQRHVDLDYLEEVYVTPETGQPETHKPIVPSREGIETYVIQEGDTLGAIAEKFGLSLSTILWSNNLNFTSTIQPGDELSILPVDGVLYTVRNGDTLSSIARNFSVDTKTIMAHNGIESADRLAIGAKLLLPGGEPPAPIATARRSASISELFRAPSSSGVVAGGWTWPTDWRVITQYFGWRHTGLDIDGDYSTHSYASRAGTVIYSGWRSGYGLCVEVDHGDGYVTRYAHHSQNYVDVGDVVSAGQALAQTGSTGRSTGTHLHFEIIYNGRFQNPLDYIR
ncbi:M23 family metallopeptidase [Candidatus Uhrbacteria bacterium]|nr:M23 family metallopeptidase [Candidatus Uhrbacteria bacterium]